ncbi:523_t:CDS:1 [Diversispora eburnea]|uniref:523_t:CDS:1 n=1 Tax=Diversispora eburnea TaxID=1213867 RepID=A0A9N8UXZ1_9GLOM|nr:523_t:CDS:1 [Diversispora eburnea]
MTCFIWFGNYFNGALVHENNNYQPNNRFKKFCRQVISAGPFSQSEILLALLYLLKFKMKQHRPSIILQVPTIPTINTVFIIPTISTINTVPKIPTIPTIPTTTLTAKSNHHHYNGLKIEYQVFACSLMLASKFWVDNTYANKVWSKTLNIPVSKLNLMEMEFLKTLDYQLYVSEHKYLEWINFLTNYVVTHISPSSNSRNNYRSSQNNNQLELLRHKKRTITNAFDDEMIMALSKRPNYCQQNQKTKLPTKQHYKS